MIGREVGPNCVWSQRGAALKDLPGVDTAAPGDAAATWHSFDPGQVQFRRWIEPVGVREIFGPIGHCILIGVRSRSGRVKGEIRNDLAGSAKTESVIAWRELSQRVTVWQRQVARSATSRFLIEAGLADEVSAIASDTAPAFQIMASSGQVNVDISVEFALLKSEPYIDVAGGWDPRKYKLGAAIRGEQEYRDDTAD